MKRIHFISGIVGILIFTSCTNQSTNENILNDTIKKSGINTDSVYTESRMPSEEFLVIHGRDIWVRDVQVTGQVVMKLNEGDRCRILNKSELSLVKGLPDYWYQVEFNNKKGWVFGSQTSLALFKPLNGPFSGSFSTCADELVSLSETPPSYSYTFKDGKFTFSVAAGYSIEGKFIQNDNQLTLQPMNLTFGSPEGNESKPVSGKILFRIFIKDNIVCFTEIENKMSEKEYSAMPGCFCKD